MGKKFEANYERMEVADYPDEKVKTMLKQSYNFDEALVAQLIAVALERKLFGESELKELFNSNAIKREEMIVKEREESRVAMLNHPDDDYNAPSVWQSLKLGKTSFTSILFPLLPLVIGLIVYLFTGYIFVIGIAAVASGATAYGGRRGMFRR